MKVHADFETRSVVNLKDTTTAKYVTDPTTDVWCLAFAFDDEDPALWTPDNGADMSRLFAHVKSGGLFYGHNVTFEWYVWNYICVPFYGFPELKIEQCRCTMAMAYAMSLPGGLDDAAAALGLNVRKDKSGKALMLRMAKPRSVKDGNVLWWDDEDRRTRLYNYCKQDVIVEQELSKRLKPLSASEQDLWVLDHEINNRGVYINRDAASRAVAAVEVAKERLNAELNTLTNGAVNSCSRVALLSDWCQSEGYPMASMDKATIEAALTPENANPPPPKVKRALELRQLFAKSSTAKIDTMLDCAEDDDRIRGLFQFHGAGTGRWAGRKVQLQNLPRGKLAHTLASYLIDNHIDDLDTLAMLDEPMDIYPSLIRGLICASEGRHLIAADYANIEGRVLAWIAGEAWKLKAFEAFDKGDGPDIYKLTYSKSFGVLIDKVTKDQRQIGKVEELALGYQGGVGAFQSMATIYGVQVDDDVADEIKVKWRDQHPCTVALWHELDRAAIMAVQNPGEVFTVSKIQYSKRGSFLWCKLPSGRLLCYPYPVIVEKEVPWGGTKPALQYKGVDALTKKWTDIDIYGGKHTENIVQAIARDLLADAMKKLTARGYEIVMHVHDEIVCEVGADISAECLKDIEKVMAKQPPEWAAGLPLAVEGWAGEKYRK